MRQYRFVHVGVAALIAAATISAVGLARTAGADSPTGVASVFTPIAPCRLADTRLAPANVGPRATPLGAAESVSFAVWGSNGNCSIPSTATGIASNVTAVNPTETSYVTIYPSDAAPRPAASNLNVVAGGPPTPNQVTVGLSAAGAISAYNNGGTLDLIIDIVGYYTPASSVASGAASLRTDKYGVFALQSFQPVNQQFLPIAGNCVTNASGGGSIYEVPLVVPVGARLISVDVATYDGAGEAMVIQLTKESLTATGLANSVLVAGGGSGGPPALDRDVLVPPATEIVGADESFFVSLGNMTAGNAYCQLSVTYDTDG